MNSRTVAAFVIPFVFVAGIGSAAFVLMQPHALERGTPVVTSVDDVHIEQQFVRVEGMAHYGALVKQRVPPRFPWQDEQIFYVFPLFSETDQENRAIRLMVRVDREPEKFVHYEFMTVEGHLALPTEEKLPYSTEISIGKASSYFFTDDLLLLEPWKIESEDGVWELPEE